MGPISINKHPLNGILLGARDGSRPSGSTPTTGVHFLSIEASTTNMPRIRRNRKNRSPSSSEAAVASKSPSPEVKVKKEIPLDTEARAESDERSRKSWWKRRGSSREEREENEESTDGARRFVLFKKNKDEELDEVEKARVGPLARLVGSGDKHQMQVVQHAFGTDAKEVLRVEESEAKLVPTSSTSVILRVKASTVTINDCIQRRGLDYSVSSPTCLPFTPGQDVVGVVAGVGEDVEDFIEGDRVAALVRQGGNARYVEVPASSLVRVPKIVESGEAVCMLSIYSTAYQSLRMIRKEDEAFSLQGKKVLVIGGMDAVGHALIQMCRKAKGEVYATAPKKRHGYIKNVLRARPVLENAKEWIDVVDGQMDFVFDGSGDNLSTAHAALKPEGKLVCFGDSSLLKQEMGLFGAPFSARFKKLRDHMRARTYHVDVWGMFQADREGYKKTVESLLELLKNQKVKPHIAQRVSLSEVAAAQMGLEVGELFGSVVCIPWRNADKKAVVPVQADDDDDHNCMTCSA